MIILHTSAHWDLLLFVFRQQYTSSRKKKNYMSLSVELFEEFYISSYLKRTKHRLWNVTLQHGFISRQWVNDLINKTKAVCQLWLEFTPWQWLPSYFKIYLSSHKDIVQLNVTIMSALLFHTFSLPVFLSYNILYIV